MAVLGVQSVAGQHAAGEVDGVWSGLEGGDLVALGGDLLLGQDHAVVVRRGQQLDRGRGAGAGAAHGLAVDRDRPQRGLRRRFGRLRWCCSGPQVSADRRVKRVAVEALEQTADGGRMRYGPDAGERVGREAEVAQTGGGASVVHSPIATRERAPAGTAAAAAHNKGIGYRRPRWRRGSAASCGVP
ncbi:hypothetical protein [Streptomyces sp. JV178]|uniref:hypothetical protein n=1 Tax=Streptomyces sp. JV178 TaxID=858632 RepID=UPI0015D56A29|nr:hypothetical protein [Streptomyces sp. JV178]